MNLIGMRPSEIEQLRRAKPTAEFVIELDQSMSELLHTANCDDQSLFIASRDLSIAQAWQHFSPARLSSILSNINLRERQEFLAGMPIDLAEKVRRGLTKIDRQRASQEKALAIQSAEYSVKSTADRILGRVASKKLGKDAKDQRAIVKPRPPVAGAFKRRKKLLEVSKNKDKDKDKQRKNFL